MGIKKIKNTYYSLTLTNTLATSLIWGINTLFLLDAGLSNTQAFLVNAFFTGGMVLFEIPTGLVADSKGRRVSYIFGTITLIITTGLYLLAWHYQAPLILWILTSLLLGLGFTFFSGATEAWLVDALKHVGKENEMETVFAKSQIVFGAAMLIGSIGGGLLAQISNLGLPYLLRIIMLLINLAIAFFYMNDLGFEPEKSKNIKSDMFKLLVASYEGGLKNPQSRWLMLAVPFSAGVGIFGFYAMQPYILELYGDSSAYWLTGLAAAVVASAQILGGLLVPVVSKIIKKPSNSMIIGALGSALFLGLIGLSSSLYMLIGLLVLWGLIFAIREPIRKAYLNQVIPSKERATVLSFDSLMGNLGGFAIQPSLGKVADIHSYSMAFIGAAIFQLMALPFLWLNKKIRK